MATVITARHIFVTAMRRHGAFVEHMPRKGSPIWAADQIIEPVTTQVQRPGGAPFDALALGIVHSLFGCE